MLMWLDRVKYLHFSCHQEFLVKELVKQKKRPGSWGVHPMSQMSALYATMQALLVRRGYLILHLISGLAQMLPPLCSLPCFEIKLVALTTSLQSLFLPSPDVLCCFSFPNQIVNSLRRICLPLQLLPGGTPDSYSPPSTTLPFKAQLGLPTQCMLNRNTWIKMKIRFSVKHYSYLCTRQESANFFHKGHKDQMLQDSGPYGLCHSYSNLLLQHKRNHRQYIK